MLPGPRRNFQEGIPSQPRLAPHLLPAFVRQNPTTHFTTQQHQQTQLSHIQQSNHNHNSNSNLPPFVTPNPSIHASPNTKELASSLNTLRHTLSSHNNSANFINLSHSQPLNDNHSINKNAIIIPGLGVNVNARPQVLTQTHHTQSQQQQQQTEIMEIEPTKYHFTSFMVPDSLRKGKKKNTIKKKKKFETFI